MDTTTRLATVWTFDDIVVPHLGAAGRVARWLLRNEADAEDAVQEASLRALRYFRTFTGGSGRAWFLQIVRNVCMLRLDRGVRDVTDEFNEEHHTDEHPTRNPEAIALRNEDARLITTAMAKLSGRARELLVLRELKGLSYREVADTMALPIGSVMSGLSRARHALRQSIHEIREMQRHDEGCCDSRSAA